MIETKHNIIKEEKCCICGKKFRVIIRKIDGKILTDCFHNYLPKHFFTKHMLEMNRNEKGEIIFTDVWDNTFWKIILYTKFQRNIFNFFWNIFYGRQRWEMWECPTCSNRKDDI